MRGKARARCRAGASSCIIPAGAGKSFQSSKQSVFRWDHPRGCGEKNHPLRVCMRQTESSPRVRGKENRSKLFEGVCGIIPAGAGKRASCRLGSCRDWDHPRGCGEKVDFLPCLKPGVGSSPRVRGKGVTGNFWKVDTGIIPAGAGKRHTRARSRRAKGDHPRGCGEKRSRMPQLPSRAGSSPRVRGKDSPVVVNVPPGGIIPAGAGKSLVTARPPRGVGDHPRGCGEK